MKKMHCPFLRTMLSAPDAPKWNSRAQTMKVEDLMKFVRDLPGNGNVEEVLRFLTVVNHGVGNRLQRLGRFVTGSGGEFSTVLKGSDGDHEGDSRIYNPDTGEFDPEQFRQFTSFSTDGKTMDIAALGRAIADATKRHKGTPVTVVASAAEFALLCVLLGDDAGTIKIADMKRLFEANQFPAGAREKLGKRTAEHWVDLLRRITEAASSRRKEVRQLLEVVFGPLLSSLPAR